MKPHLEWYLEQTRQFPILGLDEEQHLARGWRDAKDAEAAKQLLGSHLRLVVKIARGFGGYRVPLADLVAEGNVGLMQALARFDPERGFRFATYAMWWIRAAIKEYVLHNHSLESHRDANICDTDRWRRVEAINQRREFFFCAALVARR
jgi:RNA polymerase sigma-32 factor